MPIDREQVSRILAESLLELRAGILDRAELIERLESDDDWSFVIKIQALIEAVLTEAILARIGDDHIKAVIERLPLADDEIGKLAFAKRFEILDQPQRRFVRYMANLRNQLAHRVENLDFTFASHIGDLDADTLKHWQASLIWFQTGTERPEWNDLVIQRPRKVIAIAVFMLVSVASLSTYKSRLLRKFDAAALENSEQLFQSLATELDTSSPAAPTDAPLQAP